MTETADRVVHPSERASPMESQERRGTQKYFLLWIALAGLAGASLSALVLLVGPLFLSILPGANLTHRSVSAPPPASLSLAGVLETVRGYSRSAKREIDDAPIYSVGQIVRTQKYGISGHTRLPAYARNRQGDVIAYHGSHVLPDTNVNNVEAPQHLYTIRFAAQELWGPDAAQNDFINIDAWESYLVRA